MIVFSTTIYSNPPKMHLPIKDREITRCIAKCSREKYRNLRLSGLNHSRRFCVSFLRNSPVVSAKIPEYRAQKDEEYFRQRGTFECQFGAVVFSSVPRVVSLEDPRDENRCAIRTHNDSSAPLLFRHRVSTPRRSFAPQPLAAGDDTGARKAS